MNARHELQETLKELIAKHGWNEVDLELRLMAAPPAPKAKPDDAVVMGQNGEAVGEWIDNWIMVSRTES